MLQKIKSFILGLFKPIQVLLQRSGRRETIITKSVVDHCELIIEPGDIVLSHENQRPTSILIKGYFDHAAIVTDNLSVMESVGDDFEMVRGERVNLGGVREVPLEEWLYKKDHVAIIRPIYSKAVRTSAGANAYKYKGLGYDYRFSLNDAEVYCSELPFVCYNEVAPSFLKEIKPEEHEIIPHQYLDLCSEVNYLTLVFDSRTLEA